MLQAFLQRWWRDQSEATKAIVKRFVSSGQLELIWHWAAKNGYEIYSQDSCDVKSSTPFAHTISEKKNEFLCELTLDTRPVTAAVQRKGCADMEKFVWDECLSYNYTITLPEDLAGNLPSSWLAPEPPVFQIRAETFLEDRKKVFDGHGGNGASHFVRDHLPRVIVEDANFPLELEKVVMKSFMETDAAFFESRSIQHSLSSGTAALTA